MSIAQDSDNSSGDIEIIRELKVTLDRHECDLCCKGTFLIDKLLRFGGLEEKFACEMCLKSFKSKAKAVAHAKQHEVEYNAPSPVVCCKTGLSVLGPAGVMENRAGVTRGEHYSCDQCPKTYKYASSLRKHRISRHKNVMQSKSHEIVMQSNVDDIFMPSNRCDIITPSSSHEIVTQSNGHEIVTQSNEQEIVTQSNEQEIVMQSECIIEEERISKRPRTESIISIDEPLVFICEKCQEKFDTKKRLKKHKKLCQNTNTTVSEPSDIAEETVASPATIAQTENSWMGALIIGYETCENGTLVQTFSCGCCNKKFSSQKKLKKHYANCHGQVQENVGTNGQSRESVESMTNSERDSIASASNSKRDSIASSANSRRDSIVSIANSEIISLESSRRESSVSIANKEFKESEVITGNSERENIASIDNSDRKASITSLMNGQSSRVEKNIQRIRSLTEFSSKYSKIIAQSNHSDVSSSTEIKNWSCEKCLIKCKSEKGLKRHNTLQHGETHFCHVCGTSFKSSKMFMQHTNQKSCVPPTTSLKSCPGCRKSFMFQRSFNDHVCSLGSD